MKPYWLLKISSASSRWVLATPVCHSTNAWGALRLLSPGFWVGRVVDSAETAHRNDYWCYEEHFCFDWDERAAWWTFVGRVRGGYSCLNVLGNRYITSKLWKRKDIKGIHWVQVMIELSVDDSTQERYESNFWIAMTLKHFQVYIHWQTMCIPGNRSTSHYY